MVFAWPIVFLAWSLPLIILVGIAGWNMRQLKSYGLAVTASILVMLPIHVLFPIGLPIGIWSLSVLMREDIRRAFAQNQSLR